MPGRNMQLYKRMKGPGNGDQGNLTQTNNVF